MRSISTLIGAAALAGLALLAPGRSVADTRASDPVALRTAEDDFARLQEELARVNGEIAQLKRSDRSVRDDYRLRDRMADAEALAQKLGRAESRLRALGRPSKHEPQALPLVPPPQESPQDGSVELEAKADLFADQASKLQKQANIFAHTAEQLRARESLRRRAGAWDRDPFAGLESSKRNLAASAAKGATGTPVSFSNPNPSDSGTRGGSATTGSNGSGTASTASPPSYGIPVSAPSGAGSTDSAKEASGIGAVESPASKSAPVTPTVTFDRPGEQRLFLDPTAAAELRQVLAAGGGTDPRALERAAATLRARARQLDEQAEALRRKSRGQ
jgi:hypothetical protein